MLQTLLAERVSIRDLPTILEGIAEACGYTPQRQRHHRACARAAGAPDQRLPHRRRAAIIPLVTLSPDWEQAFAEALIGQGEDRQLAMAPSRLQEFIAAVRQVFERHAMAGETPVLLTSPAIRPYVRSIVERFRPMTVVMSQNEIHPKARIRTLGQIEGGGIAHAPGNFTAPPMQEAMARVRAGARRRRHHRVDRRHGGGRGARHRRPRGGRSRLGQAPPAPDVTDRLSEALAANGVPGTLAEKILMASLSFDADDELTALSGALAAVFTFAPIPERGTARPIMFVGPPGAGKTMTIAKLAARAVMAKRPIRLITADTVRAGAVEQLAALARILGLRLHAVENVKQLAQRGDQLEPRS